MLSANGSDNSLNVNDVELIAAAFSDNTARKRAKIPPTARLTLEPHKDTQQDENPSKSILEGFSCCDAARFWRAGVEVETLMQTAALPCTKEKAEKCRQIWDALEKVQIYEAQSAAAKQGAATMLRHLGEVRLGQNSAPVEDPGIGDIIFSEPEQEGEKCEKP